MKYRGNIRYFIIFMRFFCLPFILDIVANFHNNKLFGESNRFQLPSQNVVVATTGLNDFENGHARIR